MSRKTVNILMLLVAILYTLFVLIELVVILRAEACEYRALILVAIGLGLLGGLWLMVSICRHLSSSAKKENR